MGNHFAAVHQDVVKKDIKEGISEFLLDLNNASFFNLSLNLNTMPLFQNNKVFHTSSTYRHSALSTDSPLHSVDVAHLPTLQQVASRDAIRSYEDIFSVSNRLRMYRE